MITGLSMVGIRPRARTQRSWVRRSVLASRLCSQSIILSLIFRQRLRFLISLWGRRYLFRLYDWVFLFLENLTLFFFFFFWVFLSGTHSRVYFLRHSCIFKNIFFFFFIRSTRFSLPFSVHNVLIMMMGLHFDLYTCKCECICSSSSFRPKKSSDKRKRPPTPVTSTLRRSLQLCRRCSILLLLLLVTRLFRLLLFRQCLSKRHTDRSRK